MLNVNGEEEGNRFNDLEAQVAVITAINLLKEGAGNLEGQHIVILTSYNQQKTLIENKILEQLNDDNLTKVWVSPWVISQLRKILVESTTRYQGSESWVVIGSLVVTATLGFNSTINRLNVFLARAMCAMIILGSAIWR